MGSTGERGESNVTGSPGARPAAAQGGAQAAWPMSGGGNMGAAALAGSASPQRVQGMLQAQQLRQAPGSGGGVAAAAKRMHDVSAFERHLRRLFAPLIDRGSRLAHRAGIERIGRFYLLTACGLGTLMFIVAVRAGSIAAGVMLVLAVLAMRVGLWNRAVHQQRRIVRQLPSFLDGVVRLITIGSSLPAAFQAAAPQSDLPLRHCLERASRMMRAGVEIDKALFQLAELYQVQEFMLVAAVVRLSVKYGGRADLVLERMAMFMRDREMAERELVALSAETRLSAWILALLPIAIGSFIIFTNPSYFLGMWNDPTGRHLLYGAAFLQVLGVFMLFRLAKL